MNYGITASLAQFGQRVSPSADLVLVVNVHRGPDGAPTAAAHTIFCEDGGPVLLRFLLACEPDCL